MATGDAAGAAGLRVVAATKDKRLGYDDINKRGDELAAEMTARAAAVTAEANARVAADNALDSAKFDKSKIKIQTSTPAVVTGGIWFKPV